MTCSRSAWMPTRRGRRAFAQVEGDRDVEFLGQREVGFVAQIVGAMAAVLEEDLAKHRQLPGRMQAPQLGDRLVLGLAEGHARQDDLAASGLARGRPRTSW